MRTVKRRLEALIAYMREAEKNNSPWNHERVSSYDVAKKTAWYDYIKDIEDVCVMLDVEKSAEIGEIGEGLARISRSTLFEVEYDGSGDPREGLNRTYTPKQTPFNLDKYHIITELRTCVELLNDKNDVSWLDKARKVVGWKSKPSGAEDVGALLCQLAALG